jgi:hypothetical protein
MTSQGDPVEIASWLSSRVPPAPHDLVTRMVSLAGGEQCAFEDLPDRLVELAARAFDGLGNDRRSALDLLAADALITYAMEAAAESGSYDAALAAMKRIASVRAS